MIEGEANRYQTLTRTARRFDGRLTTICSFVESGKHLEQLLESANVPRDLGLISIDIDSFDYEIWKGMDLYRPAVMIIEIASGTPPGIRRVWNGESYPATTFTSMVELGIEKGYKLACHTGNLIFIRNDLAEFLEPLPVNPDELFLHDWINPTWWSGTRRKLKWVSPQRLRCKVGILLARLSGKK